MPVPMRTRSVTAVIMPIVTNGSRQRRYSSSSGSPIGAGVRRLVGMWVCSGSQIELKPRASTSRASSTGSMLWSVRKIVTPKSMPVMR